MSEPTVDEVLAVMRRKAVALPMGATLDATMDRCSAWNAYRWAMTEVCEAVTELRQRSVPNQEGQSK